MSCLKPHHKLPFLRYCILLILLFAHLAGCAESLPEKARVHRIIDGDTIELANGDRVRYIGVDTPEVRKRRGDVWVYDPEPFALEASQLNIDLVKGKRVRLEYDVQHHDRFGRLLAYVFIDQQMVNAYLIEKGLAKTLSIPPNVKYKRQFETLADTARMKRLGIWSLESEQAVVQSQ